MSNDPFKVLADHIEEALGHVGNLSGALEKCLTYDDTVTR